MLHCWSSAPSILLGFNLATVLPRWSGIVFTLKLKLFPILSTHSLGYGLQGSLILFAPHTLVSQCQCLIRQMPSPLVCLPSIIRFHPYSQYSSIFNYTLVSQLHFIVFLLKFYNYCLIIQPTYALDPFMLKNVNPSRITATAGTRLVGINKQVTSLSSLSQRYTIKMLFLFQLAGSIFRSLSKILYC